MPRDSSGNYARAVDPYLEGEVAEVDGATGVNTELDDMADALTDSCTRDGSAAWTGSQDAAGFTVRNLAASAANGQAVRHEQLTALSGVYQPLEATLTGIAATAPVANQIIRATGADTFTVDTTSTFGRASWNVADLAAWVTARGGASAIRTAIGTVIGTDVQAYDADLAALAANSTDGFWSHTGAGTGAARQLTAPAAGITITNPKGIAGDPTFALADDLAALEGLAANGMIVRTATSTMTVRTLTASTGLLCSNGDGVAGAPNYALDINALTADAAPDPANDYFLSYDASATAHKKVLHKNVKPLEHDTVAIGDETTAITTGTAKVTFRVDAARTLVDIRANVNTVSSSGLPTVNVKKNGTTIFSTKLTIDANEKTSTTAATAYVLSTTTFSDDDEITIDIDVAGTGAKGLKIEFIWYKT